jgi:hypothetical protein
MSAPESQDPDFRVPGAWLAQASKAADELLAKQVPEQGGGSPSVSMSSLDPADRLVGQEVRLAPRSRRGGSSGLIVLIVLGCIFAMALAAVIAIPPDLALYESWPQSTGDRTSEPLTSATTPMRSEAGTPKLIVEPSLGVAGKPAPIGLALRGPANDAVVLIRGLVLLCHKFRCLLRAAQHGQRESVVARAATNLRRIVAIEFGTWRSGRNGGSSGLVTFA